MKKRLDCKVSYHQVDKSESVESVLETKLANVFEKYDKLISKISWTCSRDHEVFISKVTMQTTGKIVHFDSEAENVYTTINDCVKKIEHELSKLKSKVTHLHNQDSVKTVNS
jgi:ribosomal subunit interface protein